MWGIGIKGSDFLMPLYIDLNSSIDLVSVESILQLDDIELYPIYTKLRIASVHKMRFNSSFFDLNPVLIWFYILLKPQADKKVR